MIIHKRHNCSCRFIFFKSDVKCLWGKITALIYCKWLYWSKNKTQEKQNPLKVTLVEILFKVVFHGEATVTWHLHSHITPAHMLRRPQLHKSLTANCICIHGMTRTFHSNNPKGHVTSAEILLNSFEFHQLMYFWYQSCSSDSISSPSWLSEIQSYGLHGRPLPRFQVLLSFGDDCLDPQRQRRTLTVQVTVHTNNNTNTHIKALFNLPTYLLIVPPFLSFCTWVWLHIYWALKVESVLWKVKNMILKLKHKIWKSKNVFYHNVCCVSQF